MTFSLDGFDIIEKIGVGGMATVWKARQRSLDRLVAIKVLSKDLALSPEDIRRFREEAQTAALIRHSGIVQIYDVVSQGDMHCFIMELVSGYTVGEWVRRAKTLTETEILLVADYVAAALDYAWQHYKMVHCDIKPDNVMVDADGTIKLTDFGLSRVRGRQSDDTEDDIFGTPAYISPEQAMGVKDLDCRADMYSLGAMMYHLASGTMLFEGQPDQTVLEKQLSATVPPLQTLNPKLSESFCGLVEKLLYKDRRFRHANWQAVRTDIAAVSHKRPLAGGAPIPGRSTAQSVVSATSAARARALSNRQSAPRSYTWLWMLALAALVGGAIYGAVSLAQKGILPVPEWIRGTTGSSPYVKELYNDACRFEEANPGQYQEAIARYERVVHEAESGDPEVAAAKERIERLQEDVQGEIKKVIATLEAQVAEYLSKSNTAAAIYLLDKYNDTFRLETEEWRTKRRETLLENDKGGYDEE